MRAAVLEAPGLLGVGTIAVPDPGDRALVRGERGGVCGTDVKIWHGEIPVRPPLVLGHEIVGRLVAPVDTGSASLPAGQRVVVDPAVACGTCRVCRNERPNLCPNGGLLGRDLDGGFAELLAVPADRVHPVPEAVSLESAALLQVLSTCVHAQSLAEVLPHQRAVVVGLGVSGLLHLQLLRARGIRDVIAISTSSWKRQLAASFGARLVVGPAEAADAVREATRGLGSELVVECVGEQHAQDLAFSLAGPGGQVLMFGTNPGTPQFATYPWYLNELRIINSRAALPRDFTAAVSLVADGRVEPAPLVTACFPLAEVSEAFDACSSPRQLKVTLDLT